MMQKSLQCAISRAREYPSPSGHNLLLERTPLAGSSNSNTETPFVGIPTHKIAFPLQTMGAGLTVPRI
jgi:hypothetical protein